MSDEEYEGAEEGGEAVEAKMDTGLDEHGYHVVSNRGKFQAQLNPLQQKLMEEKKKAEEKRKEAEKKAKLAEKLKAFGGGKEADKKGDEDKPSDSKKQHVPEVMKGPLDSRVKEMMSSGIASAKNRGTALLSGRGRGGRPAAGGRGKAAAADAAPAAGAGGPAPKAPESDSSDDSSSDDEGPKRKAVAAPAPAPAPAPTPSLARRSARMSLRDLGSMLGNAGAILGSALGITGSAASSGPPPPDLSSAAAAHAHTAASGVLPRMGSNSSLRSAGAGSTSGPSSVSSGPLSPSSIEAGKQRAMDLVANVHNQRAATHVGLGDQPAVAAPMVSTAASRLGSGRARRSEEEWGSEDGPSAGEARRPARSSVGESSDRFSVGREPVLPYTRLRLLAAQASATPPDSWRTVLGPVDPRRLESHLSAADFKRVFELEPAAFSTLPRWQQLALRKKARLVVPSAAN